MPEAEVIFRGHLLIMRMKGTQTILGGCSTQCMQYSVYACTWGMLVLGVCLY
jgi:hypothetical protein